MYKKFLCVILSVAMILSMVTLPGFAAGAADLSAGCVVYSDVDGNQIRSLTGGAAVKASTTLSNAGSAAADAVVWVATYDNGILVSTAYSAVSIPAGKTADVSVTTQAMPADVSNVVLYTYIWDSFTNMNSIAPVATFPSSNTDLSVATVGGEVLQFNVADGATIVKTAAELATADLTVKASAADNSAKVEIVGALSFAEAVTIKVTAADGTVRDYTVKVKEGMTAGTEDEKVYTVPGRENIGTQLKIRQSQARKDSGNKTEIKPYEPVQQDSGFYSDRIDTFKFLTVGRKLLGTTPILMSLDECRKNTSFTNSKSDYFYFTANESGTIYVKFTGNMANYEDPADGWTKVTEPKQEPSGFNSALWWEGMKAPDSYVYDPDAYPYYTNAIQYAPKDAKPACFLSTYTVTYYKTFKAGEEVAIHTSGTNANQNIIPMIAWDEEAAPMPSVDLTLKSLTYNGTSVPDFDPEKTNYTVTFYDGLPESLEVVGVPNNDNPDDGVKATTELTESTANTAVYTVTVTDKDGSTKKYTVTFRALEPKKIYDLKTASKQGVLAENGGYNIHTDTMVGGNPENYAAPMGIEDNIQDGKTLVYCDRANVKLDSKGTLNGATIIRRSKQESGAVKANGADVIEGSIFQPYYKSDFVSPLGGKTWVSFLVSSDAIIYMSDPIGAGWPNNPVGTDGQKEWKLTTESTDDKIKAVYLNKPTVWYKEVKAGDIVEIPSYGTPADWDDKSVCWDPSIFVVQWKESAVPTPTPTPPAESSNANLATLKYDDTAIALESGKTEYDVVLSEAKTVNLTWTFADDGATSEPQSGVSLAVPEAGTSQTIVVTAEDKTTTKEYKVNFTVKKVEPNTVYDLNYHGKDNYAVQPITISTPESVDDGTATPTWIYSNYIGLDKGEQKDGKYQWNTSDGYSQAWAILKTNGTSQYFEGMTLIAMDKGEAGNPTAKMKFFNGPEYDGKNGTYWTTFRVSSPGTVYYVDTPGAGWFNKPAGWKYVPKTAAVSINAASGSPLFYKHVEANELVQIPNYGFSETWKPEKDRKATEPGLYVVVWDELQPYEITISGDNNVTVGKPVTLSAAMTATADDSAVADATFKWVITDGEDKAAIDNTTGVLTPSAAGIITVAAADAAGRAIGYKDITIGAAVVPMISNITRNPAAPISGTIMTTGEYRGKLAVNNRVYTDRDTMTFAHVSSFLQGADVITVPINDIRVSIWDNDSEQVQNNKRAQVEFMNGQNDYFTFDVNKDCTVYVLSHNPYPNYTSESGWVTVNNGTGLSLPITVDSTEYAKITELPFTYSPELKYYASRVQWQNNLTTPDQWNQYGTTMVSDKEVSCVSEVGAMKYVYAMNVKGGSTVTIPTPGDTAGLTNEGKYPHTFAVAVKWETDKLISVVPEISDGGIEDTGEVAAKTASSVELAADAADFTITAQQDPTKTEITINGTSTSVAGTLVPVVVYKPGMTPAMADAAVKNGTSLDTIIAGVKQVTVKKNNTYTATIVLTEDAESGSIEIWASDGASKDKVVLDFVNPGARLAAMEAIIDAANAPENMAELLSAAISSNLAELDGDAELFNSLTEEGKKHVAENVANEIKTIDKTDINNYKKVTEPIDAASLLVALSEGKISDSHAERVLPNLSGTGLAATAVADYKAGRISDAGKAILWSAMKKDTGYYANWMEAQSRFIEQVLVNTVSNPGKNGVNDVAAAIKTYRSLSELSGCDWISYDSITAAGKGNQFASKLMVKKPASYEEFVTMFNEVVAELKVTPPNPGPGPGGSGTGSGNGSGTGTTTTIDKTPSKKNIDNFKDANDAAWAKSALQVMLDRKIYEGYEDNTIRPNNNATREEVIKILVSTFFTVDKNARSSFSDVASNEWFYPYVATGEAKGITKGMGDGTFGVGLNVTRQDFAVMIYNYMLDKGIKVNTTPYNFVDDDAIADYARDAIYALKNAEIIKGYEDNTVVPEGSATRAEIAQMVANLIVLLGL